MNIIDVEEVDRLLFTRINTRNHPPTTINVPTDEAISENQNSIIFKTKSGFKVKQIELNKLALQNINQVGHEKILKANYHRERFLKKKQIEEEQKYYTEMSKYIDIEKNSITIK